MLSLSVVRAGVVTRPVCKISILVGIVGRLGGDPILFPTYILGLQATFDRLRT